MTDFSHTDGLPDLMRRIDRKLDIRRGMSLTYDDLVLLVASGAYAALQKANLNQLEIQCRKHVEQNHCINEVPTLSTRVQAATMKSSGTIGGESANEALARAQAILKPRGSRSTGFTSRNTGAALPAQHADKQ